MTIAVLAVTIVVGNLLVLQPLLKSWDNYNTEIESLDDEIERGRGRLGIDDIADVANGPGKREESVQKKWQTYLRGDLNNTNSIAEDDVLRAIEKWTDDSRILLTSIKPQWQNHDDRYRTYDVRLVAEGTMQAAVEFVHAIESDKLPLKIEQLELASREKTGKLISVSVHFTALQLGEALQ